MTSAIDTNRDLTPSVLARLKSEGIQTVIGYLTPAVNSEKIVTPEEAHNVAAAGLRLGLVYEVWGGVDNFSHNDINAASGVAHAMFANRWAPLVGAPEGAVIYFAIDTDCTASQIKNLIVPYFGAIHQTLDSKYGVGIYGCGAACDAVMKEGWAHLSWLSNAMGWNGSRAFKDSGKWSLLQGLPQTIGGIDTDPDQINPARPGIGDFVPFEMAPAPIPVQHPDTIAELQTAVGLLPTPIETLDDLMHITSAIRTYQKAHGLTIDGVAGPQTLGSMVV